MRKHRGLSAVIGSVFLVAVVVSSLTYITYSMNTLGNFSESLITEEKRQNDKQSEEFEITSVTMTPASKLDGVVTNTGTVPLKIKSLWIEEVGTPNSVKKFMINQTVAPGNQINLINSVNFAMDPNKGYKMKMISDRGDIQSFAVNSPSSQNLLLNIRVIPEYVPSEFATTVLFTVVNNSSNNNVLYNLTPLMSTTAIGTITIDSLSGPTPTSYPTLGPGEIATFQYVYKLTGSTDEGAIFNATIVNAVEDNYVTTTGLIKMVTLASQSGTALEALGLSTELAVKNNILFLHDETDLIPAEGRWQMDGSDPAGIGTTGGPVIGTNMTWWGQQMTAPITVNPGTWNASLAYYSNLVPTTITAPSFAMMFNCNNCGTASRIAESTGNISADGFDDKGTVPVWHATGGPDNGGYFTFGGAGHLESDWNVDSEYTAYSSILTLKASTSVWFRTPPTADNFMPIVRWGDEDEGGPGGEDDEYQIALGDGTPGNNGKIVFHYATNFDADATTCLSSGATVYDDNNWHHVLAVRPVDDQCKLYIDGALSTSASHAADGSSEVLVDGHNIFVGWDGAADYFTGDIGAFMHWNGVDVSTKAYDLSRTNYGTNGTRVHVTIQRTSDVGSVLETLLDDPLFKLDFHDPTTNSISTTRWNLLTSNSTYEKYSFFNFTGTTVSSSTFDATQRLKFMISVDSTVQNLPINIRFDDENTSFVMPFDSSYVQTPKTTSDWPSYVNFDRDDRITYYAYNSGPSGAWFNYQGTRFVLTTLDQSQSYGALVFAVNGTGGASNISADKDSIYIPAFKYAAIEFYQLSNPPQISPQAGVRVPVGTYNGAVFLSGYDDSGEAFLRTIDLGTVTVYDQ